MSDNFKCGLISHEYAAGHSLAEIQRISILSTLLSTTNLGKYFRQLVAGWCPGVQIQKSVARQEEESFAYKFLRELGIESFASSSHSAQPYEHKSSTYLPSAKANLYFRKCTCIAARSLQLCRFIPVSASRVLSRLYVLRNVLAIREMDFVCRGWLRV